MDGPNSAENGISCFEHTSLCCEDGILDGQGSRFSSLITAAPQFSDHLFTDVLFLLLIAHMGPAITLLCDGFLLPTCL